MLCYVLKKGALADKWQFKIFLKEHHIDESVSNFHFVQKQDFYGNNMYNFVKKIHLAPKKILLIAIKCTIFK